MRTAEPCLETTGQHLIAAAPPPPGVVGSLPDPLRVLGAPGTSGWLCRSSHPRSSPLRGAAAPAWPLYGALVDDVDVCGVELALKPCQRSPSAPGQPVAGLVRPLAPSAAGAAGLVAVRWYLGSACSGAHAALGVA